MKTIDIAKHTGEYASKWGLTDFYPEAEAELKKALESGDDFETAWFGCKKEIRYAKYTKLGDEITVQVSCVMDDLWESDDLIYDAAWEISHKDLEDELPEEIIDSIRDAALDDGINDGTDLTKTFACTAGGMNIYDKIVQCTRDLEAEAEANNHEMYARLVEIVKAHIDYMNMEVSE